MFFFPCSASQSTVECVYIFRLQIKYLYIFYIFYVYISSRCECADNNKICWTLWKIVIVRIKRFSKIRVFFSLSLCGRIPRNNCCHFIFGGNLWTFAPTGAEGFYVLKIWPKVLMSFSGPLCQGVKCSCFLDNIMGYNSCVLMAPLDVNKHTYSKHIHEHIHEFNANSIRHQAEHVAYTPQVPAKHVH